MAAPTEFLTLNQIAIPCDRDGGFRELPVKLRRRDRLSNADLTVNSKATKRMFEGEVTLVTETDGVWIENLLDGLGEVWLFGDSYYSRSGFGPDDLAGLSFSTNNGFDGLRIASGEEFRAVIAPFVGVDGWTLLFISDQTDGATGGDSYHHAVNSDGEKSTDGAASALNLVGIVSVDEAAGEFAILGKHAASSPANAQVELAYLAVLPYVLPLEQMNEWTVTLKTVPHLPFLRMGGTCLRGRDNLDGNGDPDATLGLEVLIERGDSTYEDANFGDGDGTQHAVKIPFSIEQR